MTRSSESHGSATPPSTSPTTYESASITSARSLRQLSIFFFGAACFLASTTITRRAIYRRKLRLAPKLFEPNTNPHEHFSPFHDALMALNLATMNCVSVGIMGAGGILWAVDMSGLEEMRASLRSHLDYDTIYNMSEETQSEKTETLEDSIIRKREEEAKKKR